jgi:hypothetical protein
MRYYLDRLAEIFTFPLFDDYIVVDSSGSHIVFLTCVYCQKSLIMPKVQICFSAVFSHKAFTMLIWIEGARIYIDIRVKLLNGNAQTTGSK